MKSTILRRGFFSRLTWGLLLVGLLFFTAPSYSEEIQVDSADPSSAEQGTYDLVVTVVGDNFGADSEVDFFVTGTEKPGGIRVKKVKRQGPKTLKVTIDVAPDAQTDDDFDICVQSRGRTGKGTEMFRVLKKLETVWKVEIPMWGDEFNLWGGQPFYTDSGLEDGVWADVISELDRGVRVSTFGLAVFKCEVGDLCYGESPVRVELRNIDIQTEPFSLGEGPPCVLPPPCNVYSPSGECLKCFVNGLHPYWGSGQSAHPEDYRRFLLKITVPGDFEDLQGKTDLLSGELYIHLLNTYDLLKPEGDEDEHNVRTRIEISGNPGDAITITRVGDTWEALVEVSPPATFVEGYVGCAKPLNKKGNCPSEYKWPLWADTNDPLLIQATWTRITP